MKPLQLSDQTTKDISRAVDRLTKELTAVMTICQIDRIALSLDLKRDAKEKTDVTAQLTATVVEQAQLTLKVFQ